MFSLHGSYYGYNFGDTLLCAIFKQWLYEASHEPINVPLANKINQHAIEADHRGLLGITASKGLVFCGGGYFGEPSTNVKAWARRNYLRHILLAEASLALGKPLAILGVGFGPISSPWLRARVINVFNRATVVVVRDEESATYLKDYGFKGTVTVASDAAISLRATMIPEAAQQAALALAPTQAHKKRVFIHLLNAQDGHDGALFQTVKTFLDTHRDALHPIIITDAKPRRLTPQPLEKAAAYAAAQLPYATHLPYNGEPWQWCALLDTADLIITNKLHVGIVGCALHKPVIALPHHQKTPRFYKQMNLAERCVMVDENAPPRVEHLLNAWLKGSRIDFSTLDARAAGLPYQQLLGEFVASCSNG